MAKINSTETTNNDDKNKHRVISLTFGIKLK